MTFKLRTLESLFEDYVVYQAICEDCRWGELFGSEEARSFWCEIHVCGTEVLRPEVQLMSVETEAPQPCHLCMYPPVQRAGYWVPTHFDMCPLAGDPLWLSKYMRAHNPETPK